MKGKVTSVSPLQLTKYGDTIARPIADWPKGMTLLVGDVVWFEMDARKVLVTQRLASTP